MYFSLWRNTVLHISLKNIPRGIFFLVAWFKTNFKRWSLQKKSPLLSFKQSLSTNNKLCPAILAKHVDIFMLLWLSRSTVYWVTLAILLLIGSGGDLFLGRHTSTARPSFEISNITEIWILLWKATKLNRGWTIC